MILRGIIVGILDLGRGLVDFELRVAFCPS
jgi:hypothetical protein